VATRGSAVLFWNSLPVTDNRKPDYILSSSMFGTPRNISTDGSTWFFVGDHNAKVTGMPGTFFWNSYPQSAGQPYDFYRDEWIKGTVLPDGKLIAGGLSRFYLWNKVPVSSTAPDLTIQLNLYKNGDGPDIAYAGGKLFVNNYNGNNVLVYNSVPTQANQPPDFAVGSITPATNTLDSIHYIQNPVIATDGKRLIATSDFDRSLWIWKTLPQKSGTAPDLKMSLTGIDLAPWDNALYNGKFVAAGKSKIAVWDNLPLNGELPDRIFNGKIGTAQFQEIKGVALDSLFIYVADQSGKIFVWNNLPVTGNEIPFSTIALSSVPPNHLNSDGKYLCAAVQGNPPAVYIYRVQDILSMSNPLPYKIVTSGPGIALNLPAEAATYGNALAIANTGNHSVLIWKDIHSVGQESPVILGQPVPPTYKAAIGDDRLFMPASLAFTDSTLWVGEVKFSSRILKFSVQKPLFSTLVSESSILVFPNPFSNRISAENTNGGEVFSLYDATGNIIWSGSDIDRHDFSFLGKGLYFLMINGNSPARQFIKLIKE
jgi:hypothetical protein